MNRITNLFARQRRNLHLLTIVLLAFTFIIGKSIIYPPFNQIVFTVFYYPFAKIKNGYLNLKNVSEENMKLREMLVEASLTISNTAEAEKENLRLRSVLGFEQPPGYKLVPAEVVSISGEYIPVSAVINKGADDSIMINQPVVNQQGLIGRIESVSKDFAVIKLLTDPSNRVASRLSSSREMGIIKYDASEGMILDNFPIQGGINVGDTVLSSGLGGLYPSGLLVGIVSEVFRREHEVFCDVKVSPAANFFSIDELFVLRSEE